MERSASVVGVSAGVLAREVREALGGGSRPFVLALDGRSGAGKTTLAARLGRELEALGLAVVVFSMEVLYQGWEGLAGAVEQWRAISGALAEGGPVPAYWGWDWAASEPTGPFDFPLPGVDSPSGVQPVLVCEGVGSACGQVDWALWVETPGEMRKRRALARDGETYAPYWEVWAAQEEALLAREAGVYRDIKHISPVAEEE